MVASWDATTYSCCVTEPDATGSERPFEGAGVVRSYGDSALSDAAAAEIYGEGGAAGAPKWRRPGASKW